MIRSWIYVILFSENLAIKMFSKKLLDCLISMKRIKLCVYACECLCVCVRVYGYWVTVEGALKTHLIESNSVNTRSKW